MVDGPAGRYPRGVQIIVQLDAALAQAARGGRPEARALLEVAAAHRCALQPVHPTVDAPPLSTYFTAQLNASEVEGALAALRDVAGVRAAYAKPEDSPA